MACVTVQRMCTIVSQEKELGVAVFCTSCKLRHHTITAQSAPSHYHRPICTITARLTMNQELSIQYAPVSVCQMFAYRKGCWW